tara:strand:+ start:6097 stop:6339 length:243 start_codon:yes stop_codon:yes gene_type:complete
MFLIEYDEGLVIDGEEINWISIRKDGLKAVIKFTLKNELKGNYYTVDDDFRGSFINNLQVLNDNINVEVMYHKLIRDGAT